MQKPDGWSDLNWRIEKACHAFELTQKIMLRHPKGSKVRRAAERLWFRMARQRDVLLDQLPT